MKLSNRLMMIASSLLALGAFWSTSALAQKTDEPYRSGHVIVGHSYHNDVSAPLSFMPLPYVGDNESEEAHEGPENPPVPRHHVDSVDPVVQNTMAPTPAIPGTILNFDGILFPGVGCNCAPPDTDGEVGSTQFVQMVNEGVQVFDKATGTSLMGPVSIESLWTGFGGACETGGGGDPVVLYDQIADRWVISQFASATGGAPITDECVAVSQTSDATGSYNRYGFHLGSNFFDYPHLGVWPDGYYMSMNVFNASGTAYLGPQPFAFDRTAMLAGNAATFVTTGLLGSSHNPILPGDLDGSALPPTGAPNPFLETPDTTYQVYGFHADFATPANSTFNLISAPAAAGYTQACTGGRSCVPQLGTTTGLDGIGDRLMFRLAYRNFGDHESLVGNFTVAAGGVTGVRWFELRDVTSGPVTVFQESTYQPDSTWRWMGSAAMDGAGNLAVGFSASSASINPQIRYAGRLSGDPLNMLAQGEAHLFDGTGSQNGGLNRWGDYSDLTVDPVDDCTFWYTNEYIATDGSFNWRTRVGNFKFDECGTPGFTLSATPPDVAVCAGTPADFTINVGSISDFNSPVTLAATGNPAPSVVTFSPNPVTPLPGTSAMSVSTSGVAAGAYPIDVNGTAAGADPKTTTANLTVYSGAPPAPSLNMPADGAINQPLRPTFTWSGSNTATYTIDVATDSSFTNIVFTQDVTGTSVTADMDLASNTQYYWRVTPVNPCGTGTTSETFTFTTMPLPGDCSAGTTPQTVYSYGFESGLNGWTLGAGGTGNTWADNSDAHSGAHAFKANDPSAISDQRFVSPPITLPTSQSPVTLQFWHKRDMENSGASACFDGGIVEISNDGGATWTQLANSLLLTDPYNGPISSSFGNPLAGLNAYCNVQDYTDSIVDIDSYAGDTVQFRYRLGSDSSVARDGWYLDDVKVQSCAAGGANHTVTPSVGTPSGTITPDTPQTVTDGATIDFTLAADSGFHIDNVGGTCGGALSGNVYTTNPVTADCTVIANFAPDTGGCPGGDTFCSFEQATIPDDGYDGTLGSMACTDIDASALPAGSTVTNVTMTTGITHTWAGDLTAKLISPDGSILGVFSRPGLAEAADDGTGCCGDSSNLDSTSPLSFDDTAANDAETMGGTIGTNQVICADDGLCDYFPNPGAVAVPPANFADFAGETASGTWELCVGDSGGGDTGTLDNWTITISHAGGVVTHTVTPSVGTPSGTITPDTPQTVADGATTDFTLAADSGFHIDNVGGTCGGNLAGNVYTTNPVTADCTVIANFAADGGGGVPGTFPPDENFDEQTAPNIPSDWSTVATGAGMPWVTDTTMSFSAPNAAHAQDFPAVSDMTLDTPSFTPVANQTVSFQHAYNLESTFDGAVLEISINGGAFSDIITAGGSFESGGYDGPISTSFMSPIAGRQAWTGDSGGFIQTVVDLPATAVGQPTVLRFRTADDNSVAPTAPNGWWVDDIHLDVGAPPVPPVATVTPSSFTFTVAEDATASDTLNIANAAGSDPLTFSIISRGSPVMPILRPHVRATAENSKVLHQAVLSGKGEPTVWHNTLSTHGVMGSRQPAPWLPRSANADGGTTFFQLDDGTAEDAVGFGTQGPPATEAGAVWINRFQATSALTIDSISIFWGDTVLAGGDLSGLQANLVAYYDADGDGDPSNAVRLGADDLVTITTTGGFQDYPTNFSVPGAGDVYIGFVDQWALAGGYTPRLFPAAIDEDSGSQGMSYVSGAGTPPTDIDNLGNNDNTDVIDNFGLPGNWLIRATGTGGTGGPCTGPVVTWLTATPAAGTVNGGENTDVTVTVNPAAGGLTPGDYSAELCITTNDPTQTLISVPVDVTVTPAGPPDGIFCDGFELGEDGSCGSGGGGAGTYTDRDTFLGNVATGYFDNPFDDAVPGLSDDLNYSQGGFAYTVGTELPCDFSGTGEGCLYNDTGLISTNFASDQIVVTFTGDPVTAVGGNFWATDVSVQPTGTDIIITLSDGTIETFTSTGPSDFRGFVTPAPITSITIDAPDDVTTAWATMDNLIVGSAQ